jgi:hypothetical protein
VFFFLENYVSLVRGRCAPAVGGQSKDDTLYARAHLLR